MEWTKEKPTEPGYYWYRFVWGGKFAGKSELRLIKVYGSQAAPDTELRIAFHGTDWDSDLSEITDGEWAGPIEPPA